MMLGRYKLLLFRGREHGEESLKNILNKLNSFHLTITFTAEYSKGKNKYFCRCKYKIGRGRAHETFVC